MAGRSGGGERVNWIRRLGLPWRVPAGVREVMGVLAGSGHAVHLVGGCVRDLLLGRRPKGWDLATDAVPERVVALLPGRCRPLGPRHGTVTVLTARGPLEVTTYRGEAGYVDHRHPSPVRLGAQLLTDLARRDFTVNAMALTPDMRLVDPFHGQGDLRARLLRAVGKPALRLREDALRMLRAARLAAELRFSIHGPTLLAIQAQRGRLGGLPPERVRQELIGLACARHAELGLRILRDTGMGAAVLPEADLLARLDRLPAEPAIRLGALLLASGPRAAADALRRLHAPRQLTREVLLLVGRVGDATGEPARRRRLLFEVGRQRADAVVRFARLLGHRPPRLPGAPSRLAVDGRDVMAATGLAPGPAVGRILALLGEEVCASPAANRPTHLLARARALAARPPAYDREA